MSNLPTTQSSLPAKKTSPDMSEALTSLLDSQDGNPEAIQREIAGVPALLEEARAVLPQLKAVAERKAGREGVKAVIGKRFALYPQPQRSDGEAAAWWADYYDVLEDVPLASLEAAMRAYVADPNSEFMPKPGKLRELAFTTPSRSLARYYRAKRAVQIAEEAALPPPERANPEAVRQIMDEFNAKTAAGRKIPELPSIAGRPDAGGLTAEMRAVLARRQEQA